MSPLGNVDDKQATLIADFVIVATVKGRSPASDISTVVINGGAGTASGVASSKNTQALETIFDFISPDLDLKRPAKKYKMTTSISINKSKFGVNDGRLLTQIKTMHLSLDEKRFLHSSEREVRYASLPRRVKEEIKKLSGSKFDHDIKQGNCSFNFGSVVGAKGGTYFEELLSKTSYSFYNKRTGDFVEVIGDPN
jgi:hypothetical protein